MGKILEISKKSSLSDDFSGKYLESNFIIQKLIKNFFCNIEKVISKIKVEKILETGCGSGFSTYYLSKILKDKDFQASELIENLVEEAQKRNPEIVIQQESIYKLKREADSFDLVIALEVLEHLENPSLALEELNRVTSKYCLLSVPNEPIWRILNMCRFKYLKYFGNTPGHIQHWSKSKFIKFLGKYYKIREIKTPLPWIIVLTEK